MVSECVLFVILSTHIILVKCKALTDPYFTGLANSEREPITQPISKFEFEFERRKLARDDVRELIYREVMLVNPTVTIFFFGQHPTVTIMVLCLLTLMSLFRFWSTTLRCCSSFFAVGTMQTLCIQGLCALLNTNYAVLENCK